jgi:DNA-directed RNA polymerase subunit M/transcription elongation factor TFIIS
MIRLKCPKCAESLTVDDEDAGGVGECGECGAKFRIPAAKAKPARVSANNATDDDEEADKVAAGPPPRRQRRLADDDDDRPRRRTSRDEDDEEEEEEEDNFGRPRRRPPVRTAAQAEQFRMNVQMGISLGVVAILMAAASVFIYGAGFFIAYGALFFVIVTGIAMMITVYRDSPLWAILIFLVGTPAAIAYAIMNWDKIGKLMLIQCAFTFVCVCAFIGGSINLGWREVSRELKWKKIRPPTSMLVRGLDVAWLPAPVEKGADPLAGSGGFCVKVS